MTTTNTTNVGDILKQLETLNKATGIDIYIPSLGKTVKFKNLNLRQQKELLSSSIDESLTRLSFIVKFYNIIQENAIDSIDISNLYIFDRLAIAITLRANGVGASYTNDDVIVDLNEHLTTIKDISIQPTTLQSTIGVDNLTIDIKAPTLGVDRDICSSVITKLKNIKEGDVKTLVSELFIHEIIKFIQKVTFKTENGDQGIAFNTLKLDEKLSIVEKIPATLTNKILEFIKSYRELESKFVTVNDITIDVDGSFFSI